MLELNVPAVELYDDKTEEFFTVRGQLLKLEHSLVSLAKWESKWCKPFLTNEDMTNAETVDYIRHMTISQNVDAFIYHHLMRHYLTEINTYMALPMTATTFRKDDSPWVNREIITAEVIYYWMTVFSIPFECQKWHLNRLLTFINVCNVKNQPKKKMSKAQAAAEQHALNAKRLKDLGTKG